MQRWTCVVASAVLVTGGGVIGAVSPPTAQAAPGDVRLLTPHGPAVGQSGYDLAFADNAPVAVFTSDADLIGGTDPGVYMVNTDTGSLTALPGGPDVVVTSISDDARWVAAVRLGSAAHADDDLIVIDTTDLSIAEIGPNFGQAMSSGFRDFNVEISGDGSTIVLTGTQVDAPRPTLRVFDRAAAAELPGITTGAGHVRDARVSDDAQIVVFTANETDLPATAGTLTNQDAVAWDRSTGILSLAVPGGSHLPTDVIGISGDGRYVLVGGQGPSLDPRVPMHQRNLFRFDRQTSTIELASVGNDDLAMGFYPAADISTDGDRVVFHAYASATRMGGIYGAGVQAYTHDFALNVVTQVSLDNAGLPVVWGPAVLAANGLATQVVFASQATYLGADADRNFDVFVADIVASPASGDAPVVFGLLDRAGDNGFTWYQTPPTISWTPRTIDAEPLTTPPDTIADQEGVRRYTSDPVCGNGGCASGHVVVGLDQTPPYVSTNVLTGPNTIAEIRDALSGMQYATASLDGESCSRRENVERYHCVMFEDVVNGEYIFAVQTLVRSGTHLLEVTGYDFAGHTMSQTLTITFPDTDSDGVADAIEDGAPNGGDGNSDGLLDSQQSNVASLPGATGPYLTVESPVGTTLSDVAVSPAPMFTPIPGSTMPFGVVRYGVNGVTPGGSVVVRVIVGDTTGINGYVKQIAAIWRVLPSSNVSVTPTAIELTLVDGGIGDDDLVVNGVIRDPGGPGVLDLTPPTIECPTPAPTFDQNSSGLLGIHVTDAGSGVSIPDFSMPVSTATVGSFVVPVTSHDLAGNAATASCAFTVRALLVITGTVTRQPNAAGWYRTSVTVRWRAAGVTIPNTVLSTEGGDQSAVVNVCNGAGLCGEGVVGGINIDLTPPVLGVCPAPPTFLLNQTGAVISLAVTDALSGPTAATAEAAVTTSAVGSTSVVVRATDRAGNTVSRRCTARVVYDFKGFAEPITEGFLNTVNRGAVVPVRWRITDAQGVGVSDPASFVRIASAGVACQVMATDAIESTTTGSGLMYLGDGNWEYRWSTSTSWRNCRELRITLKGDATAKTAQFKFN